METIGVQGKVPCTPNVPKIFLIVESTIYYLYD